MKKVFLPLGSVVLLKGAEKRLMICGRVQTDINTGITYDYSACLYPDGYINADQVYMFNNENIEKIFFLGFQDEEEFEFKKFLDKELFGEKEEKPEEDKQ